MNDSVTNQKTIKAGFWYIVCNFLSKGLVYITTPFFARLLSNEQFGEYTNFTTWQGLLLIVVTLQLHSTISVAKIDFADDLDGYISTIAMLGSIITIVSFIIVVAFRPFFETLFSFEFKYILILFLYLIFAPALQIFQTRNQFLLKYRETTIVTVLFSILSISSALICCSFFHNRLLGRIVGYEGALIILNTCLFLYLVGVGKKFKYDYCKYALKVGFPLAIHLLAGSILASCDKILIGKYCGSTDLALYGLGFTCAMVARVLWESLNQAMVPWLFEQIKQDNKRQVCLVSKGYVGLFFLIIIGFTLVGPELIMVFGGKNYCNAKYVLPPIFMAIGFQLVYSLYVNIETYYKKTKTIAIGTVASAIINLILNIIFIKKYGYIAAAYTTAICYLCLCFFSLFKSSNDEKDCLL